jgi:hypothetical protein
MTTNNFWDRDVNVTLHIEVVDYILWTLGQNIDEILDSPFRDVRTLTERNNEVERLESIIKSIRSQAGYPEEVA